MNFDKLIFSVGYNMTGNYETTRDVVQDINLKLLESPITDKIIDRRSYVIRMTINRCLNLKKKEQRIQYIGTWLPEPIKEDRERTIQQNNFEQSNLLCYELAFLMEQLSQTERAVFVLREAFDYDHKEIAEAINISSDNSRQLLRRAKAKVANLKHRSVSNSNSLEIAKQFVNHIQQGNIADLLELFNEDISVIGDGGGKAPAIAKPIFGKKEVAQFFFKLFGSKTFRPTFSFTEILSQPAITLHSNGDKMCAMVLSIHENRISRVFGVLNPDKLLAL